MHPLVLGAFVTPFSFRNDIVFFILFFLSFLNKQCYYTIEKYTMNLLKVELFALTDITAITFYFRSTNLLIVLTSLSLVCSVKVKVIGNLFNHTVWLLFSVVDSTEGIKIRKILGPILWRLDIVFHPTILLDDDAA